MIKILVRKIEELDSNERQSIVDALSESARARLNKKKNEALHLASLCALSLLSDAERADLDYTVEGRPFFKSLNADISITHSSSLAAVAISQSLESPVGIDLEDMIEKPVTFRFLTENEQKLIESGTPYLNIWTKKEALFKFLKNDPTPFIQLDSTTPEKHGAKLITVALDSSILTACVKKGEMIKIIEK